MKLHELVDLRNRLKDSLNLSIINQEIENNFERIQTISLNTQDLVLSEQINALAKNHQDKKHVFDEDVKILNEVIDEVQQKINMLATKFFAENYKLEIEDLDAETIRNLRKLEPKEEFESLLLQRINLYSNWQFPALEIGCRDGVWTKYLVASDPLYIADIYPEFFASSLEQFPPLYQGRVRRYLITNYCRIDNLPMNQFGFIFSYNFFNYLSLDSIKQLLIQSYQWLRPGGKIIFTYNNADLPAAAGYAESYYMTYVPKSILLPMAESLGYEITFTFDLDPAFSIVEFKKPGALESIKLAQVLGETRLKTN